MRWEVVRCVRNEFNTRKMVTLPEWYILAFLNYARIYRIWNTHWLVWPSLRGNYLPLQVFPSVLSVNPSLQAHVYEAPVLTQIC